MEIEVTLTPAQEQFAQLVASGKSQSEAYRTAYPKASKWADSAVWSQASRLLTNSKVSARVVQIRAELAERGLWSREQSVRALTEILSTEARSSDRIKAIAELNKMHGYHAPEKHEHSGVAPIPFTFVKSSRE